MKESALIIYMADMESLEATTGFVRKLKDDGNFTAKNISTFFPQGLESIVLKPHMVEFEEIELLAKNNPQSLR